MTQAPGPYRQTVGFANHPTLSTRAITRANLQVPVIGQSIRSDPNNACAVLSANNTGKQTNLFATSGTSRQLIDIRVSEVATKLDNNPCSSATGQQPDAQQTTFIVRVGLSSALSNSGELATAVFKRDTLLAQWEQHERQLSAAGSVILVVEGLAALYNSDLDNEVYFTACIDSCLATLSDLKSEGRISGYGLVADHAEYCQRALLLGPWDIFVLNHRYTLLEQWPLYNLLPACAKADTSVIVGHPFNTGVLRGQNCWNFRDPPAYICARLENIRHICRLHDVPVEAAALQFPLGHSSVSSVLVDPLRHGEENLQRWLNYPIAESLWDDLKLGGVMHEEAPVTLSLAAGQH